MLPTDREFLTNISANILTGSTRKRALKLLNDEAEQLINAAEKESGGVAGVIGRTSRRAASPIPPAAAGELANTAETAPAPARRPRRAAGRRGAARKVAGGADGPSGAPNAGKGQ